MVCLALERDAEAGRPVRGEMSQELKQAYGDTQNYIAALEKQLIQAVTCLEDVATRKWGWVWEEVIEDARDLIERGNQA